MEKYLYFDGLKFTRDDHSGYYANGKTGERMHRYVWKYYNGEIPEGCQIHHIDHDKSNNNIENLEMLDIHDHMKLHNLERAKEHYQELCDNLNKNARPKANEWHASEEGREWHREHYEEMGYKLHQTQTMICEVCGKEYQGYKNQSRFCSNNCKSKWRRQQGLDNEVRICEVCGKEFTVNKYSKARTCSKKCAAVLRKETVTTEVKMCEYCGHEFLSINKKSRFCSNICRSRWKKANSVGYENRICEVCGKEYNTSKYADTRTCSRECQGKLRHSEKN